MSNKLALQAGLWYNEALHMARPGSAINTPGRDKE